VFDEEFAAKLRVRLVRFASSKGIGRAEDIAQETLMVLWAKYSDLDREADLVPLAYNICSKKIFEARRFQARAGEELPDHAAFTDPGPDPYERLMNDETRHRLLGGIRRLSPRCRQLIRLRLLGRSTEQIAEALKMRTGTLHVWKHRCLKALIKDSFDASTP
jgi:RNA polymerase sigma factor (sigma-70 family)